MFGDKNMLTRPMSHMKPCSSACFSKFKLKIFLLATARFQSRCNKGVLICSTSNLGIPLSVR